MSAADHGGRKIKGSWSPQEDATLVKLVEQNGPRNWSLISTGIPGRSGKSCRLRWCNQLSPDVEHRPFTPSEDDVIIRAHTLHGNKWATISRLLPGRTDNAIKNHWNSTLRRRRVEKGRHSVSFGSDSGREEKCQVLSASGSGVKRAFTDGSGDSTDSELELKRERKCSRVSADYSTCDGPETLLTLFPPGGSVLTVTGEEKAVENGGGKRIEAEMTVDDAEERSTVKRDDTCLVTIMKRMIAEEVRIYINTIRAKEGFGPEVKPMA